MSLVGGLAGQQSLTKYVALSALADELLLPLSDSCRSAFALLGPVG